MTNGFPAGQGRQINTSPTGATRSDNRLVGESGAIRGDAVSWSLDQAYGEFPQIEDEFSADLDESLHPRGPDVLYDIIGQQSFPAGAAALDVGCGEGMASLVLARRFGFAVTGIDPVARHVAAARAAAAGERAVFLRGTAEQIPAGHATFDLVWCRDVLVHVRQLPRAYAEFRRVLKPGGLALVYQMFGTDRLEPAEAACLWDTMGVVPESADPARTERAIAAAGLVIDERIDLSTEWGEWSQEHRGIPGRKLLHAARLQRGSANFVARYGQRAYDMMLGDCLWHVYAMIGKLTRRAYLLSRPG
jgi:ubiquinone/menaquinone biosynthesis C-methylase UbiE